MNKELNLYPVYNYVKEFINKIIINEDFKEYESLANKYFNLSKEYNNLNHLLVKNLLSQPIVLNYFNSYEHGKRELNSLFNTHNLSKGFENYKNKVIESVAFRNPEIIKQEKIKKLNDIGILDWDLFKTLFRGRVEANIMKEALGWVVGFVESGDYNLDHTIVKDENNEIDKKGTLLKILNTINKKSLTKEVPFIIQDGNIHYTPAPSGNLDVLFWCETEQKVYGMCVTRDKKYQIEGNQFIRHHYKLAVLGHDIEKNAKERKYEFLHTPVVKKMLENIANKEIKKELTNHFFHAQDEKITENFYKNDFVKNLLLARKHIYDNTGVLYSGTDLGKEEMQSFLDYANKNTKFTFFGEVLNNNQLSQELAGMNLLSYKENFEHINPINLDKESIDVFFDNINAKYNLKTNYTEKELETKAKVLIREIITQESPQILELTNKYLGEGYAYKEERANVFKAIKNLFSILNNEINEESEINNSLKNGFNKFFTNDLKINDSLIENFKDKNFVDKIYNYLDDINKGQAEVQYELKELKVCLELFKKNIEVITYKEKINNLLDNLTNNNEINKEDLINEIKKLKM